MTDQINSPADAVTVDTAEAQARADLHSRIRGNLQSTIAGMANRNSATLEAQGKPGPVQGTYKQNVGGQRGKLNGDGTFTSETFGEPEPSTLSPSLTAHKSRQSEESMISRMNQINRTIEEGFYFDSRTGERKTTITPEQRRVFETEFAQLRKSCEAQMAVTAQLEASEAQADKQKARAIEREQVIRTYANGDPARERAIRAQLAELEAKDAAAAIYKTYQG